MSQILSRKFKLWQVEGLRVESTVDLETKGGTKFPKGAIFTILSKRGGWSLRSEVPIDGKHWIHGVSSWVLVLIDTPRKTKPTSEKGD